MKLLIERALYSVIEVDIKDESEINAIIQSAERGEYDEAFDEMGSNENSGYSFVEIIE